MSNRGQRTNYRDQYAFPGFRQMGRGYFCLPITRRVLPTLVATLLAMPLLAETVKLDAASAGSRAVTVSHVLAAASGRRESSEASITAARAATLPSVAAIANLSRRSSVPEFSLPFTIPGQSSPMVIAPDITTTYATGLRIQHNLYTGGAITAGILAAKSEGRSTAALQSQAEIDLRFAGQLAYWESVRGQASVLAATAQLERTKRLLTDTRALLDAGMAVRADLLAAEERVANAEVGLINARMAVDNALATLRSLLDLADDDQIELADTQNEALPTRPAANTGELQRQAGEHRPELAVSQARIETLRARESAVLSSKRPMLAAAAQYDYARPNMRYFPQKDKWKSSWAIGLTASWSLFDGGRAKAESAVNRALQKVALEEKEEIARRISLEVENARRQLDAGLALVVAADSARAAALEREKAARERFQAGLAAMAEILDAEAGLAAAEQLQINARANAWMAEASLTRALGQ